MSSSLDNFLHDHSDKSAPLTNEEKAKFEKWIKKILSGQNDIAEMIESALKQGMYSAWETESSNHKFKLGSYYPSIIEKCLRSQAYSYLYPVPPTSEELAIFNEGSAIHELIALALRRSGLISVEGSEVVVDLEFNSEAKLHGRIDDLLLVRISEAGDNFKVFVPLEIKSTSTLPDEPRQSHYYQLSTYLLAQNYPLGVLLYWAKREGKVKAFTIAKDEAMSAVLRERVLELHDALKSGTLPQKEAVTVRDYAQCDRCSYSERCNPYLIDSIPVNSHIALFDIDGILFDTYARRRAVMQELGLPPSAKSSDIQDEETIAKYWELFDSPKYIELDTLIPGSREKVLEQIKLGRVVIGISSSRKDSLLEYTRARLANLEVPIFHLILREPVNHDTSAKFKARWATRLSKNYEVKEFFDRDAVTSSVVMKGVQQQQQGRNEKG